MKKLFMTSLSMVVVLALLLVPGCGKKDGGAASGGGGDVDLLSLLPGDASAVITLNAKKLADTSLFDDFMKQIEEKAAAKPGEVFKNYQDFVQKTGIDPKKDINGMAMALLGKMGPGEPDFVVALSVKYDRAKLLELIKAGGEEITEEKYGETAIFTKPGEDFKIAFINDGLLAAGKDAALKKTIDLSKGTGDSVLKNPKMSAYLKEFNSGAIMNFAALLPDEAKKVQDSPMFKVDLTKAEAVTGFFTLSGSTWKGAINLINPNEEANNQLVSALNQMKPMAAMAGPEAAELANTITIKGAADSLTLDFAIPQELVDKLVQKAKEKAAAMAPPTPPPADAPPPAE